MSSRFWRDVWHRHLTPQWKVLVSGPDANFAIILSEHWTLSGAERRVASLEGQWVRGRWAKQCDPKVDFTVQKKTCY